MTSCSVSSTSPPATEGAVAPHCRQGEYEGTVTVESTRPGGNMALVVARTTLDADDELEFWLSRPVAERIAAVEVLRNRVFGGGTDATGPRLQRVCRVVQRP